MWFVHNKYTVLCCDTIYIHYSGRPSIPAASQPTDSRCRCRSLSPDHIRSRLYPRGSRSCFSVVADNARHCIYVFILSVGISINPQRRSYLAMLMRLLFRLQLIIKALVALSQSSGSNSNNSTSSLASSHRDPISISLR